MNYRRRSFKQFCRDAREYWPEDLLMDRIFWPRRRFLRPTWWIKRIVVSLFF